MAGSGVARHGLAGDGARAEADVAALVRARRQVVPGARAHAAALARRPLRPRRHRARARRLSWVRLIFGYSPAVKIRKSSVKNGFLCYVSDIFTNRQLAICTSHLDTDNNYPLFFRRTFFT